MATPSWHGLEWKLNNGEDTGDREEPESPKQNIMLREEEVAAHQDSELGGWGKKAGPIDSSPRG